LGKYTDIPRPIKIELLSSRTVFDILKSKHKPRSDTTFGLIRISTDRTTYQHNYLKNVLNESTERKLHAEQDLTLKYLKAASTISKNGLASQADQKYIIKTSEALTLR